MTKIDNLKKAIDDLPHPSVPEFSLHKIAEAVRALEGANLSQFISPASSKWSIMSVGLKMSSPEDALDIFKVMADALKNLNIIEYTTFLCNVFECKNIRTQAIKVCPDIFTKKYTGKTWNSSPVGMDSVNCFHALSAATSISKEFDFDSTSEIIKCLKEVGAEDFRNPSTGNVVLHQAANQSNFDSFRAFVEHFPGQLEAKTVIGKTPLHKAAMDEDHRKLQLLLDRGVNPRSVNDHQNTPLDYAVGAGHAKNAMALIDTGVYSMKDIEQACSKCDAEDNLLHELSAYHAACGARRILHAATNPAAPRPL